MATADAIRQAWQTLDSTGCRPPFQKEGEPQAALRTWQGVLADVDDDDLHTAVQAHMSDPDKCRWWPKPGELLGLARQARPQIRQAPVEEPAYADRPWMRLHLIDQQAAQDVFDVAVESMIEAGKENPCGNCQGLMPCDGCTQKLEQLCDRLALSLMQEAA